MYPPNPITIPSSSTSIPQYGPQSSNTYILRKNSLYFIQGKTPDGTSYFYSWHGLLQASQKKKGELYSGICLFCSTYTKLCCYDRKCRVHKACRGDVHTYNACGSFRQMHRYAQFSWHHGHLPAVGQSYGFGICRICVLGRGDTCYRYCDACDECT